MILIGRGLDFKEKLRPWPIKKSETYVRLSGCRAGIDGKVNVARGELMKAEGSEQQTEAEAGRPKVDRKRDRSKYKKVLDKRV